MAENSDIILLLLLLLQYWFFVNWQVLALLDIVYLASAAFTQPYKTLKSLQSASSKAANSSALMSIMPYVEIAGNVLMSLSRTAIVWVIVLVTLDRYMAVCRPLLAVEVRTKRRAQRAVIGVVIAAVLYNVPRLFEWEVHRHFYNDVFHSVGMKRLHRQLQTHEGGEHFQ